MKILTKKKQEKIMGLLRGSGFAIACDSGMSVHNFQRADSANLQIAKLVGGESFLFQYSNFVDHVLKTRAKLMQKKDGR